MSGLIGNPLFFSTTGSTQSQIERSLRFNSADSAYLSRTPASAGNRKTWTWAGWVKRVRPIGGAEGILEAATGTTTFTGITFDGEKLVVQDIISGSYNLTWATSALYRDYSAWYHIVVSYDTTQASATNAVKIYVNGSEAVATFTANSGTYAQNRDSFINSTVEHRFAGRQATLYYASMYLAETYLIDGQALTPSSFGEFDANNVWQPKAYTGSYGTNGFKLNFSNNSAATAAALGADSSGNGNNWTPNNLSVTAGAGNDSLVDIPTSYGTDTGAGGEVRGNYCTWNPVDNGGLSIANGNLDLSRAASDVGVRGTFAMRSGKWYWECTATDIVAGGGGSNKRGHVGLTLSTSAVVYPGDGPLSWGYVSHNGNKYTNSVATAYGASWVTGDVIGVAFDADAGSLTFYKNGVSQGVAFSGLSAGDYLPAVGLAVSGAAVTANFGQRPFAYTAPSGFKALCTANLPTPTIANPATAMDVVLYTGTGATLTPTSTLGFSPDLVWIKSRSAATDNTLYDSVRGAQARLESNTSDAQVTSDNGLTAFNSNGFTLGTLAQVNTNAATYAAWAWDAGSSTVTNTSGTISSQVRANPSAGFSVVTATVAGGLSSPTIGHGLGVTPGLIIAKSRNEALGWYTWHQSLGASQYLQLNSTGAVATSSNAFGTINSSVITIGGTNTSNVWVSGASGNYVFYCFAPVAGYSAFGSYTGNGSADGPFVYTGFKSRFVLIRRTDAADSWIVLDTARNTYNPVGEYLVPNTADSGASTSLLDINSNGFKLRFASSTLNASGGTYIYAAFAESPFQYARAR